jgi:hypothetical protein
MLKLSLWNKFSCYFSHLLGVTNLFLRTLNIDSQLTLGVTELDSYSTLMPESWPWATSICLSTFTADFRSYSARLFLCLSTWHTHEASPSEFYMYFLFLPPIPPPALPVTCLVRFSLPDFTFAAVGYWLTCENFEILSVLCTENIHQIANIIPLRPKNSLCTFLASSCRLMRPQGSDDVNRLTVVTFFFFWTSSIVFQC